MDKKRLDKWKYINYERLRSMNSYYFPLEPFYKKDLKIDENLFKETLLLKNKGLYIHIPFCVTECSYCACTKIGMSKEFNLDIYVDYIIKELEFFYKLNDSKKIVFNTLTFGGGTPSILSVENIELLFNKIYNYIDKKSLDQISFECAPYTMTNEKIDVLKKVGVNRISFGIQSLNKNVLSINNRPYIPKEKIGNLIDYVKESGIFIEADLIVGIKGQTIDNVVDDIKFLLSRKLDDITFNYFSPHKFSKYIDDEETILIKEKFKQIEKKLVESGKVKGSYCFQERYIYSARRYSIIGLGYGATSNLGNSFVYVKDSLDEYYKVVDDNTFPISSGIYLNDKFEIIKYIYRFIFNSELDILKMNDIFKIDVLSLFSSEFNFLFSENIIKIENNKIVPITDKNTLFIYLTIFIEDIIENSKYSNYDYNMPDNIDVILRQMIYDYII